ncbi:MAG: hypothetical protein KDD82_09025 [Planctomycetes bacterium]|nr:hypothetical protein [Planctomycetota bacterium]
MAGDAGTLEDAGPAPAHTRLPWYSFLYRLLGAQGTFWLWILCVGAVWWTLKPALVRLSNRRPHTIAIEDVTHEATARMIRWVTLTGVEVTVDGALLRRQGAVLPPVPILLDAESHAGRWWLDTLRYAERVRAGDRADDGTAAVHSGVDLQTALLEITERMAKLDSGEALGLPLPERAVLVQDERLVSWNALPPGRNSEPARQQEANAFIADRQAYVELVHERVRADVVHEGVLEWTPTVVQRRLDDEIGFPVASYLLQAKREPRDWESVVCATALILLIFLGAGLIGAARVRQPEELLLPDEAPAEPPAGGAA